MIATLSPVSAIFVATALLLVLIIIVLNLTAITLRNRLEARYKAVES